jgi:hypothetical protein
MAGTVRVSNLTRSGTRTVRTLFQRAGLGHFSRVPGCSADDQYGLIESTLSFVMT